jgi:hypothetical protein
MAGKREKGKIPRGEWPNIQARYNKGETMAQLARAYECTAPAIRYILKPSGVPGGELSHGSAARPEVSSTVTVVPSCRRIHDQVLGPELHQRISGDVASFLVALDYVDLEGSPASVANLQEATDGLMRSAARTRLELERLLSGRHTAVLEVPPRNPTRDALGYRELRWRSTSRRTRASARISLSVASESSFKAGSVGLAKAASSASWTMAICSVTRSRRA